LEPSNFQFFFTILNTPILRVYLFIFGRKQDWTPLAKGKETTTTPEPRAKHSRTPGAINLTHLTTPKKTWVFGITKGLKPIVLCTHQNVEEN
jgi:hypothetical protein